MNYPKAQGYDVTSGVRINISSGDGSSGENGEKERSGCERLGGGWK